MEIIDLVYTSTPTKAVRTKSQRSLESWKQELCRGNGGVLLTGLLIMVFSACFCIEHRTNSPGMAHPQWAVPPHINHQEMSYRLTCCPILWRHFLSWGSLLSNDSSLCQADIKLASTYTLSNIYWNSEKLCLSLPRALIIATNPLYVILLKKIIIVGEVYSVCECAMCHRTQLEVTGQLCEATSLLSPLHGFWRSNSSHQASVASTLTQWSISWTWNIFMMNEKHSKYLLLYFPVSIIDTKANLFLLYMISFKLPSWWAFAILFTTLTLKESFF